MGFVGEFSSFLHRSGILKFGDFTLASGRRSPFYIDVRLVPGHPVEFRRMVKALQGRIIEEVGLDGFDSFVSVPTGGLVIASALAMETVKPIAYARSRPKDHGTSRLVEGRITSGMRAVMVDDVATTGGSMVRGIRALRDEGARISDAYVIVDRMEGAAGALEGEGVRMHSLADMRQIAESLHAEGAISADTLGAIKARTGGSGC